MTFMRWTLCAALLLTAACQAGEPNQLFGQVTDTKGGPLVGATIQVQSESTGARWMVQTDREGAYFLGGLAAGRFKVTARMPGFRTVSRTGAVLDTGSELRIDFALELLAIHEIVTVTTGRDTMDPSDSSSLLLTRTDPGGGTNLPVNGGDPRVLFDLMPGVIITPAQTGDAGQFTANGQRPNSNVFRIDGMSANTGVGNSTLPGAFPVASLPAMTAIGSTENLVSNDTAQSVELRTSDLSPEYSNRPGAEVLVNTRSGSNQFHEEFYGNIRDNGWNARDWFANSVGLAYPRPSYYRYGAAFGGPLRRNRTFYFLSAEEASLTDTGIQLTSVPSMNARQNAPDKLKQLLTYYPRPIGPDLGGGEAEGIVALGETARLVNTALRIDQSLGRHGNLFFRVAESPSRLDVSRFNWASGTAGFTIGNANSIDDLRFNYSRADLLFSAFGGGPGFVDGTFGLAGLLPGFTFYPDGGVSYSPPAAGLTSPLPKLNESQTILALSVPGLGQFLSSGMGRARQNQEELRDTYTRTVGRHELHLGLDYIRLTPSRDLGTYAVIGVAQSLQSLLDGAPLAVTSSSPPQNGGHIDQIFLFAQDTVRINERLSLFYGSGWEITPPTPAQSQVPTVSGLWDGTNWISTYSGEINATAPWPMRFGQFSPRLGAASRLGRDWVLRAGAGIFYDATLGASVNPINGAPFNSWLLPSGGSGIDPATGSSTSTASQGANSPDVKRFLQGSYPALHLPASYQWRASVEKQLAPQSVASVSYLGSVGRNLLGHEAYVDPTTGVLQRIVTLTENSSNYQSLQARYTGPIGRNLFGTVSYTWSHSADDGSQDSAMFLIHPGYQLSEASGSSSFDVRHAVSATLSYELPGAVSRARLPPWLSGWSLSGILRARSGFPIDVFSYDQALGQGFDNVGRPNLVPGVPLWISDSLAPGNRRLNPAAFDLPAAGVQGNLGRNLIRGNGLFQIDASLRREFALVHGISGQIGLNMFNVLNHPAFADPVPYLSSPWFGQSTSMQNLMLGAGSPNTGLPPLFQTGGARSVEFSFRVSF